MFRLEYLLENIPNFEKLFANGVVYMTKVLPSVQIVTPEYGGEDLRQTSLTLFKSI